MLEPDLSPSLVTQWAGCDHFLTKELQKRKKNENPDRISTNFFDADDERTMPRNFTEMLFKKGLLHEKQCFERYKSVYPPDKILDLTVGKENPPGTWTEWIERVGNPFEHENEYEIIFQMPFKFAGMRGIADFLERRVYEEKDESGNIVARVCYEPVDSKLTRNAAKISHIKQLLFYTEAIKEAFNGKITPKEIHVALGTQSSSDEENETRPAGLPVLQSFATDKYRWQWDRTREQLHQIVNLDDGELAKRTEAKWCSSCTYCKFLDDCSGEWGDDPLHEITGILETHMEVLKKYGIDRVAKLALLPKECIPDFEEKYDLRDENHDHFQELVEILESRVGVTTKEIRSEWESRVDLADFEMDPYSLTRLWRQARLQTIKRETALCPRCGQRVAETESQCRNEACKEELRIEESDENGNKDEKQAQGEGLVLANFFSKQEMREKMQARCEKPDVVDWQLEESLLHLPEMHDSDIYLDFEGHPFWTIEEDIIFLFGYIVKEEGEWGYKYLESHDDEGNPSKEMEAQRVEELINFFYDRVQVHPEMKVYHYNHTERHLLAQLSSSENPMLSILAAFGQHASSNDEFFQNDISTPSGKLSKMISDGVFVDLLAVIRNSCQVGCKGFSLKKLEQIAGFQRGEEVDLDLMVPVEDGVMSLNELGLSGASENSNEESSGDISAGAGAVYEYELYANYKRYVDANGDPLERDDERLERIRQYNKDDVDATREVHAWLLQERAKLDDISFKKSGYERPEREISEIGEQIQAVQEILVERAQGIYGT
ncbi:MAG: hypothetical protein QF388_07800 [Acidimicrobiales bacterium]|nr:hypothetical protein [Acidimicrobiales bacterium]